jgi:hypothetical protein
VTISVDATSGSGVPPHDSYVAPSPSPLTPASCSFRNSGARTSGRATARGSRRSRPCRPLARETDLLAGPNSSVGGGHHPPRPVTVDRVRTISPRDLHQRVRDHGDGPVASGTRAACPSRISPRVSVPTCACARAG